MYYRSLGATGEEVSTVSYGCNRLGEDASDTHWDVLVGNAIGLGVFFSYRKWPRIIQDSYNVSKKSPRIVEISSISFSEIIHSLAAAL